MDKLQQAREIINRVDKQMADLFVERMSAVKTVAEYKMEKGLPILDQAREQQVIEKNSALVADEELKAYYIQFIKNNMAVSRSYQHHILEGAKVAYSGVEGAFANIAAKKIFPDATLANYGSFNDAYQAVVKGECDSVVLPIENSYAGEVGQVLDLMFSGPLHINGVYDLPIVQNLLAVPGATMDDIKKVVSHPQALAQCAVYIHDHDFEQIQSSNTAVAAQKVASDKDKSVAAIASAETATLYGLNVLDHNINQSSTNTTRFAVFSQVGNDNVSGKDNSFILMFTVNNTAGALAKAIDIIGKYGFNMRVLRSRPMKELAWKYYFYVEADGDANGETGKKMIQELSGSCDKLKVVGNYNNGVSFADTEQE